MKDYFDKEIKPLNDKLGTSLCMKKIEVEYRDVQLIVPVTITYVSHTGNTVTRKIGTKSFYEAMGLKI